MTGPGPRPLRVSVPGAALALLFLPAAVAFAEWRWFHAWSGAHGTIEVAGEVREYRVHVPAARGREGRRPLVVSLHGAGGSAGAQELMSQWNRIADEHGFVVAYPSAVTGSGPRTWRVRAGDELSYDVRFIEQLIDTMIARHDVDPARVYVDGLSNGGGMAFVVSCTLPDRVAAVGMVGAAQTLPSNWCPVPRPMPMITIHGTGDTWVPYEGGFSRRVWSGFPNVDAWVAGWAMRNGCGTEPDLTSPAPRVTRFEYSSCTGGAAVVHYRIEGGGHVWPGGRGMPAWFLGESNPDVDAARELWRFYSRFRANI